ncbi:MAG TPA: hypothetical protein VGW57_01195 [Chthoniobacterales bacterium]|nr:hypothetical protein [Chthoniobacterales bacterium]
MMLILGILILGAALVGFMAYLDRRRAQAIQAAAAKLGLTYRRKPTEADKSLINGCHVANTGHGHITSNVLEAAETAELRMTLFDHIYTIGYGKSAQSYNQTVTRMQSPLLNLPPFVLFPETFFSKVGKLFGGADINFPEAPQFSRKYILRGPDEAAIRAVFTPAVLQFFERQERPLTVDSVSDTLFTHRAARRAKPEELASYITEGKQILALFFEAQRSRPAMPPPLPSA